jgi:hypothetical protein
MIINNHNVENIEVNHSLSIIKIDGGIDEGGAELSWTNGNFRKGMG